MVMSSSTTRATRRRGTAGACGAAPLGAFRKNPTALAFQGLWVGVPEIKWDSRKRPGIARALCGAGAWGRAGTFPHIPGQSISGGAGLFHRDYEWGKGRRLSLRTAALGARAHERVGAAAEAAHASVRQDRRAHERVGAHERLWVHEWLRPDKWHGEDKRFGLHQRLGPDERVGAHERLSSPRKLAPRRPGAAVPAPPQATCRRRRRSAPPWVPYGERARA